MIFAPSESDLGEASGELGVAKENYEKAQKEMLNAIIEKNTKEK